MLDTKTYAPAARKAWLAMIKYINMRVRFQTFVKARIRKTTTNITSTANNGRVTIMDKHRFCGVRRRF